MTATSDRGSGVVRARTADSRGERRSSRVRRLLTTPIIRLVAAGAVLLAAQRTLDAWRAPGASDDPPRVAETSSAPAPGVVTREPIVIDAAQAASLERGFVARWGRPPEAAERRALLGEAAQDEMLYREARVLQLGLGDASVRRRLLELLRALGEPRAGRDDDALVAAAITLGLDDDVIVRRLLMEKMRLVLQSDPGGVAIDDLALADALERNRTQLVQPEMVSIEQVFVSSDRRGDAAVRDASRLGAKLRAGTLDADGAVAEADALPLPGDLRAQPHLKLQARFGKTFADTVLTLDTGVWSEPIASPFGWHVVRVVEKRPERLPTVDEARPALVEIVRRERARANLTRGLARLRELYDVRIATDGASRDDDRLAAAAR
jgi:hypothetical protein